MGSCLRRQLCCAGEHRVPLCELFFPPARPGRVCIGCQHDAGCKHSLVRLEGCEFVLCYFREGNSIVSAT